MNLRALAGIAVVAAAAVAALAFENTAWYGPVTCTVKAKIVGEKPEKQVESAEGVSLNTTNSTFQMGPIAGSNLKGLIIKQSATHYKAAHPAMDPDLADFLAWVKAKILARTGIDVDLATAGMTGSFTLIKRFTSVKVNLTIRWTGTVASGEDAGKAVFGTIKLKSTLPRD